MTSSHPDTNPDLEMKSDPEENLDQWIRDLAIFIHQARDLCGCSRPTSTDEKIARKLVNAGWRPPQAPRVGAPIDPACTCKGRTSHLVAADVHFAECEAVGVESPLPPEAAPTGIHDACEEHANVIADQRNAAIRHGRLPDPDDNHTSDGRCKYPAACASEAAPTAGEGGCPTCRDGRTCVTHHALRPATPPADDASEGLSKAEREALSIALHGKGRGDWLTGGPLIEAVERIKARARAEGAAKALREAADAILSQEGVYMAGVQWSSTEYAHWLRHRAASIAHSNDDDSEE